MTKKIKEKIIEILRGQENLYRMLGGFDECEEAVADQILSLLESEIEENDLKEDSLSMKDYKSIIYSKVWQLWEKEQIKRFRQQAVIEKRKRLSECYGVAETVECGRISKNHLFSFCKFLIKLYENPKRKS